jgi:hypothetical protein
MRLVFSLLASLLVLALGTAGPAVADEAGACGLTGFGCENMCPLAHQANEWRATGTEALGVPSRVQADAAQRVRKNLARI